MCDGNEYLQNILFKKINNNNIINIKSRHVFLSWHAMKILQSAIAKKKKQTNKQNKTKNLKKEV
jgi:hypothetical protein